MLGVSVARQLGSGNSLARLLCYPAQPSGAGERRLGSVKLTMPSQEHRAVEPRQLPRNIFCKRRDDLFAGRVLGADIGRLTQSGQTRSQARRACGPMRAGPCAHLGLRACSRLPPVAAVPRNRCSLHSVPRRRGYIALVTTPPGERPLELNDRASCYCAAADSGADASRSQRRADCARMRSKSSGNR
jgi:hypothetical protein